MAKFDEALSIFVTGFLLYALATSFLYPGFLFPQTRPYYGDINSSLFFSGYFLIQPSIFDNIQLLSLLILTLALAITFLLKLYRPIQRLAKKISGN